MEITEKLAINVSNTRSLQNKHQRENSNKTEEQGQAGDLEHTDNASNTRSLQNKHQRENSNKTEEQGQAGDLEHADNASNTRSLQNKHQRENSNKTEEQGQAGDLEHADNASNTRSLQNKHQRENSNKTEEQGQAGDLEHADNASNTRSLQNKHQRENSNKTEEQGQAGDLEHADNVSNTRSLQNKHQRENSNKTEEQGQAGDLEHADNASNTRSLQNKHQRENSNKTEEQDQAGDLSSTDFVHKEEQPGGIPNIGATCANSVSQPQQWMIKARCKLTELKTSVTNWIKNDKENEEQPGRISNIGATCYANSVFQVLGQTPGLKECLQECKPKNGSEKMEAIEHLLSVLNDLTFQSVVDPQKVHALLKCVTQHDKSFLLGQQNDCHSFLLSLMNILKEGMIDGSLQLFEGKQCNQFSYSSCDHEEKSDDQMFNSLLIPVQENSGWSVEDGLEILFIKECFDNNIIPCRICEGQNKKKNLSETIIIKQTVITELPKILILQIARFKEVPVRTNSQCRTLKKIDWSIQYREYLDITEFCTKQVQTAMYRLYAVISHTGNLHGGHYYANVRKLKTDNWFYCSDSSIGAISHHQSKDKDAYLLFYEKEEAGTLVS